MKYQIKWKAWLSLFRNNFKKAFCSRRRSFTPLKKVFNRSWGHFTRSAASKHRLSKWNLTIESRGTDSNTNAVSSFRASFSWKKGTIQGNEMVVLLLIIFVLLLVQSRWGFKEILISRQCSSQELRVPLSSPSVLMANVRRSESDFYISILNLVLMGVLNGFGSHQQTHKGGCVWNCCPLKVCVVAFFLCKLLAFF